ncbi:DUF2637 domain-containing protein [Streptomyces violaceusniger]|uniref:DUF2637 domain-containing protein n=1 Tax=Streptomyces violaceusniger TaxID=68280 RepID=UPI003803B709
MRDTLTGEQTPATTGAMAGAAPDPAGAAPGSPPATPGGPDVTPPGPRKGGRARPGVAAGGVSTAPAAEGVAPANVATPPAARERTGASARVRRVLAVVALLGMIPVTAIGFAASYSTLAKLAERNGFSPDLAPWIPVGIDGAIVAFLALDLYLTARRIPWPVLRFAAHGMTLATIIFNASESGRGFSNDPVRAAWHGVMPLLFVVGVEGARRLLVHIGRLEEGTATDRIPLHRWVLSFKPTWTLYRSMRLANVRSYDDAVQREKDLTGYRVWLTQQLGGNLKKASEEQLLPMTMAPRGYTVEEALALPAKWQAEQEERQQAEAERKSAEQRRQAEAAKLARIQEIEDQGDISEAQHRTTARTGTAAAEAEAARVKAERMRLAAERQAEQESEAMESADAARLRKQAEEDNRLAEEEAAAAAVLRKQAADTNAEAERREAEADRITAERAALRKQAEEDNRLAEEAKTAAAAMRQQAADLEARAQVAEDYARLNPRERNERRVARMIAAADPVSYDPESVPLKVIMDALGIRQTAAGEIRAAAVELLRSGYRPEQDPGQYYG